MKSIFKIICIVCIIALSVSSVSFASGEEDATVYVSASGDDSNLGTEVSPFKTLAKAYQKIGDSGTIVVEGSIAYTDLAATKNGTVIINGAADAILTLPSKISLKSNLCIDNVVLSGASTIYANGKKLVIGEGVTSNARMTVFGGVESGTYYGDTDIVLLGGLYQRVYGGSAVPMTGNTNVVFGGNANAGDGNNDQASNISPCLIYGGNSTGDVVGETNITLTGNAVTKMIYGAGAAGGATKTSIYIEGGKAMNVFGGTNGATLNGCSTNVTITGGLVEAIFGGSESRSMTNSHTHVNLLGGDVSRRVYSGCYNGTNSLNMATTHFVNGTTTLIFGKDAKVNSKTGLASTNQKDIGVYGGSRLKSVNANEKSTVIYLDNCYSSKSGTMGAKDLSAMLIGFKNNVSYTVKAGEGGAVTVPDQAGKIRLIPDMGNVAKVASTYYVNEIINATSTTEVTFEKNFKIEGAAATVDNNKLTVTASATLNDLMQNASNPQIYVVVTDAETSRIIAYQKKDASLHTETFEFDIKSGEDYKVKAMLWNDDFKPLASFEEIFIEN